LLFFVFDFDFDTYSKQSAKLYKILYTTKFLPKECRFLSIFLFFNA